MPSRSLRLRIGGLTLTTTHRRPTPALDPPAKYHPFSVSRGGDVRLMLSPEAPPEPRPERLLFDSGGPWRLYRHRRGLLYLFDAAHRDPTVYKGLEVDAAMTLGTIYHPDVAPGRRATFALAYPLEELLFQHRLARDGAIVVHACGATRRGRALLFCGVSGAGKSTLGSMWQRAHPDELVLSDDRIVLRPESQRVRAYGTPWHGTASLGVAASRRADALFFLRQGKTSATRRLRAPAAAALLLARSFPPMWSRQGVARALDTCSRVAKSIPAYELTFRRDASALAAIDAALGG